MKPKTLILMVFGLVLGATALAAGEPLPAWAYPWVPDYKVPDDDGILRSVPDSVAAISVTQQRDLFLRRIGIQPTTHPCPRWLRGAANPRCAPVAPATAPKAPVALKTPVWPGCLPLTSSSRYLTTKAVRANSRGRRVRPTCSCPPMRMP